jgi:hypothetical protein
MYRKTMYVKPQIAKPYSLAEVSYGIVAQAEKYKLSYWSFHNKRPVCGVHSALEEALAGI